jgi:hypothetical protein
MRTPLSRLASTAMALWLTVLMISGAPAAVAQQDETAQVERVIFDLVRAEGNGDYNLLYDYMAPESRDMLPRQAFITWFTAQDSPVPTGVPEIGSIEFQDGEYEATGTDYENLAYVEYTVPVDGDETESRDLVLASDGVTWRWFFDMPEDEIDAVAEEYGPYTVAFESLFKTEIFRQLDMFWAQVFADHNAPYRAPIDMVGVNVYPAKTSCGEMDKEKMQGAAAMYCGLDETIYFDVDFREWYIGEFGQYSWDHIIAHEWGHHIQNVLGLFTSMDPELYGGAYTIEHELQADCLAAIFAQDSRARGIIRNRDIRQAEHFNMWGGDPEGIPWDMGGAHGTPEQRVESFWLGYNDGFRGCYVDIASMAN